MIRYSMEIVLYCIEIMQFQQYIQRHLDSVMINGVTHIEFPDIPNSEIIDDDIEDTLIQNVKTKANKLFEKYIEAGTSFEINISGTMRDALTDTIGDLNELQSNESIDLKELYTIFEESVQEMMTLQSISFERFKQSEAFDSVKSILIKRESLTLRREKVKLEYRSLEKN